MCNLFNDGLIEKSKEELIKIKDNLENYFAKDNLKKIDDKSLEKYKIV